MVSLQQIHGIKPISSYYSGAYSNNIDFHTPTAYFMDEVTYKSLVAASIPKEEIRLMSAQKHKEAERERRVRINGQYANLRMVLPNLRKRNKASVLAETVNRLKELVNTAAELKQIYDISRSNYAFSGATEMSRVEYSHEGGVKLAKVMFSCEDREKLMSEIAKAVRSVKGKVVKAEISVTGGWNESVVWVQGINGNQQLQILGTALDAVTEPRMPNHKLSPYIRDHLL